MRHRSGAAPMAAVCVLFAATGCSRSPSEPPSKSSTSASARDSSSAVTKEGPSERITKPATPAAQPAAAGSPIFTNIAPAAGITQTSYCGGPEKNHILESLGSGCALIDYDGDGLLDVFVVNAWELAGDPPRVTQRGSNKLYHNLGNGRFEDVTAKAGLVSDQWGIGVCAADFDNDGRVDLYVTNFGRNCLYRNRGDGTFEEVAEKAGVALTGMSTGAAFFDSRGDGNLDLYVAQYVECTLDDVLKAERTNVWRDKVKTMVGPFGLRGARDHLFRNDGHGHFTDATDEAGMTDTAESYGLGVCAGHFTRDGAVDVFVANDSNPNFLYRNDGHGHFTDIGAWSGCGMNIDGRAQAGMGVDAADLDGAGSQDILLTTFARDYATLYHNDGKRIFTDVSVRRGLKDVTYGPVKWGCAFFDYDNDGQQDIVIVNGHIYPQVDAEPSLDEHFRILPTLLHNENNHWTDVSRAAGPGLQIPISGRGLAVGDINNDGYPDLLMTCIDGPPLLLRNDTPHTNHWLTVRLLNEHGSPSVNARAFVTAGGRTQMREVRSGSAYVSQSSFDLYFGLGKASSIDTVEVLWPDGHKLVQHDVRADQLVTIRQAKE